MRNTLFLSTFLMATGAAVFACSAPSVTEGTHESSSKIIGGTASTSTDDDSVVLLWMTDEFCTGSLIAPNLVLTARHCVSAESTSQDECAPFGADKAPSEVGVALGQHPSSDALVAHGAKLFLETQSTICGQDIALVLLDQDVATVKPKQVRLTAPVVNELVTAMGYGVDENQQINGRMFRSNIPIQAVGPATQNATANGSTVTFTVPANDFMTGESVCNGDSGGPIFDAQGLILGTTSRGTSLGCVAAPAIFSSTAAHAALIKTALAAAGHPLTTTSTTNDGGGVPGTIDAGATGNAGTTSPSGTDPSGPTPGPAKGDDSSSNQSSSGDGNGNEDGTSDGNGDTTPARRPNPAAIKTGGCTATPISNQTNSAGLFLAFAAALAFVRRRRSA